MDLNWSLWRYESGSFAYKTGGVVTLDPCGHLCSLDGAQVTVPTPLTQGEAHHSYHLHDCDLNKMTSFIALRALFSPESGSARQICFGSCSCVWLRRVRAVLAYGLVKLQSLCGCLGEMVLHDKGLCIRVWHLSRGGTSLWAQRRATCLCLEGSDACVSLRFGSVSFRWVTASSSSTRFCTHHNLLQ